MKHDQRYEVQQRPVPPAEEIAAGALEPSRGCTRGISRELDRDWRCDLTALEIEPQPQGLEAPPSKLTPIAYLRHAASHFINVVFVVSILAVSLATSSLTYLSAGILTELMYLLFAPRIPWFRRGIAQAVQQEERLRITMERENLLLQMSVRHRMELERLEALIGELRNPTGNSWDRSADLLAEPGPDLGTMMGERVELERLLTSYARLAIAHRRTRQLVDRMDRSSLHAETARLVPAVSSSSRGVRDAARRRHAVASRRLAQWERATDSLAIIEQQLATLIEVVELLYEQRMISAVVVDNEDDQLDRLMGELVACEEALCQVA